MATPAEHARYKAEQSEKYATRLLTHYFGLIYEKATGSPLPGDCYGEIETIAGTIIEAAVDTVRAELGPSVGK